MQGRIRASVCVLALATAVALIGSGPTEAAKRSTRPIAQPSFTDQFSGYDTSRWIKADGWKNGSPFDNAWLADHVTFANDALELRLDDVASLGEPYSSGELRTIGYYGYGCYEAKFRPVKQAGVVTAFFTYAGPYDNGGNGLHNEIDIEFVGHDTRRVQLNWWTNDDSYSQRNEVLLDLGFDASTAARRYGFKWTSKGIGWYLDGNLIYQAQDSTQRPTPKAADSLQKIMMNLWPVDSTASGWAGTFTYPGTPLRAGYDWVRYTAGEDCAFGEEPTPPPTGDPAAMHVLGVGMALNGRGTQAIATVSIVDGTGRAVSGATVVGRWSGAITAGDTSKTTDANGLATLYSSQTRTSGNVQFCVTGVTGGGRTYESSSNVVTCATITK
jgi:endo-1,3-1,4-beta-glycanase ExoK